jgi:imidazole glycerol phosphate synthase glutamine amidotransferase subunit
MIGIIDYGAGNLRSVKKAVDYLGIESRIIRAASEFDGIDKVILPGVGAFGAAIETMKTKGLYQPTAEWLQANKPFLGICLGLQMLFEESEEAKGLRGFGIFKGKIPQFRQRKVPQIGWNQIQRVKDSPLLDGIPDQAFFYFLHGYYVQPEEREIILTETEYGSTYTSAIVQGNIYAVQFHPEKSSRLGIQLLKNWVTLC